MRYCGNPARDAGARGLISGLTRNAGAPELARAALEAVGYQTADLLNAMRKDWRGGGETVLRATITERVQPGVVYTTFHFPESGANVITTDNSDWATNCPEYKVTAVQVMPGRSAATVEIDHPEHRLGALVRMANQIARQMAADISGDPVAATALHLEKFWEREMRVDLISAIDGGTVTLDDIAVAAMNSLRATV